MRGRISQKSPTRRPHLPNRRTTGRRFANPPPGKFERVQSPAFSRETIHLARNTALVILAMSPPIIFAFLAAHIDRWDLFERSGSITTAFGLLLASRRYIRYGVIELASLHSEKRPADATELIEDIFTAKQGLALSAFGTIIWGWGEYMGWWSFLYLLIWALLAARDAKRDTARASHDALSLQQTAKVPRAGIEPAT